MAQQAPGHPVEGGRTTHRIVAAPAVDVDVDEPGRDIWVAGRRRGCRSPAPARRLRVEQHVGDEPVRVDRDPATRDAVIEDQPSADGVARHQVSPVTRV